MSRLRRLKQEKRKNRIKVASCGLALALAIGSAQVLGTFALFSDTVDVTDNLAISTGDVDVEAQIVDSLNKTTGIQPGDSINGKFKIINNGTLKQNLILNIDADNSNLPEEYDILDYLDWSISFEDYNEKSIIPISKSSQNKEIRYNNENNYLVTFNPLKESYIIANVELKLSNNIPLEVQNAIAGKDIGINLQVSSYQINTADNIKTDGFWDRDIQYNTIQLGKINIISGDNMIKTSGYQNNSTNANVDIIIGGISSVIDVLDLSKISIVENTGTHAFKDAIEANGSNNNFFKMTGVDLTKIGEDFEEGETRDTIQLKFEYRNKPTKIFEFNFKSAGEDSHGNLRLEAKFKDITGQALELLKEEVEIPNEPEVVEPPKEETEVQAEPEIVKPPKEEVETPSEPEVVEPPKEEIEVPSEPEIVEPPKQEITEIPRQQEAIEPPKENEGIQE